MIGKRFRMETTEYEYDDDAYIGYCATIVDVHDECPGWYVAEVNEDCPPHLASYGHNCGGKIKRGFFLCEEGAEDYEENWALGLHWIEYDDNFWKV